jgi:hypothetical protein
MAATTVSLSGVVVTPGRSGLDKLGQPHVAIRLRVRQSGGELIWRALGYSPAAREALLSLHEGDSVSLIGTLRADAFISPDGKPRLSLRVFATEVLAQHRASEPADNSKEFVS